MSKPVGPAVVLDPNVAIDYLSFRDPEKSIRYSSELQDFKVLVFVTTYCDLFVNGWRGLRERQQISAEERLAAYGVFVDYIDKMVSEKHLEYFWPFLTGMPGYVDICGSDGAARAGSERIWCACLAMDFELRVATDSPHLYEGILEPGQIWDLS